MSKIKQEVNFNINLEISYFIKIKRILSMFKSIGVILIMMSGIMLYCCNLRVDNDNRENIPKRFSHSDTSFYGDGTVFSIIRYNDSNQRHGITEQYYYNGNLMDKVNYWNGMVCGDIYSFYENGTLSLYRGLDVNNKSFYSIEMDSLGSRIIEEKGCLLSSKYIPYPTPIKNYKLNENYVFTFVYANPKYGFDFIVDAITLNGENYTDYKLDMNKSEIIINACFKERGNYTMILSVSLFNSKINYFKKDKLYVYFTVE